MRLTGVGAVAGFASGPAWRHTSYEAPTERSGFAGPLDPSAVAAVAAAQLEEMADQLRETGRPDDAAGLEKEALIAGDPELLDDWRRRLQAGEDPLAALEAAVTAAAAATTVDVARAAHLRDLGARMARIVTGTDLDLPGEPSIVIADDLSEAMAADIPPGLLLGMALESGSQAGPAVILARRLGIPCVVGIAGLLAAVDHEMGAASGAGVEIGVDGVSGLVFTHPTADELDAMKVRKARAILDGEIARGLRDRPAATKDGHRVRLLATISGPADVAGALEAGAEGIGLFRTEALFRGRQRPPTEDEQVETYRQVFEAFGPDRPVVVRLADLGADADLPWLRMPHETNPSLGVRGIRLGYRDRTLLVTQVRAISRAASAANVEPHITAAMVATLADVDLLNELIRDAQAGLAVDGLSGAPHILTGLMVDAPSGAFLTREFAPRVDFFSLDMGRLTQYLLAADRTNPALADYRDALHPAVVRAVRMVTGAAGAAEKPVTAGGDLAGDPAGALVLVGLGVDQLTADASSLDALRYHLAAVSYEKLQILAARALDARDAAEVRALANDLVDWRPAVITPGKPPS